MFNKKTKTDTPSATKLKFAVAQLDILISAAICIALVFGSFFWVQKSEQPRVLTNRVSSVASSVADHQARIISASLDQLKLRVSSMTKSPQLAAALQARNDDFVRLQEQQLALVFPEALDTKLIALGSQGIADQHSDTQRLRNNIEIDMLRKTIETGELVVEAYQDGERWLISFTQLVNPQGAVFITFPAKLLADLLRNTAGTSVYNELAQSYKSNREIIIPATERSYPEFMQSRRLSVPDWNLVTYPSDTLVDSFSFDDTLLWLISLICMGLIGATHAIFFYRSMLFAPRPVTEKTPPKSPAPAVVRKAVKAPAPASTAAPARAPAPTAPQETLKASLAQKLATREKSPAKQPAFEPLKSTMPPLPDTSEDSSEDNSETSPPLECFRAYDIRGIADTQLTDNHCRAIAQAIAAEALARGQRKILLGRDGRLSSQRIRNAMVEGLLDSGVDVIDLGLLATPMLHFASRELNIGNAVMITGSHNPGHYNGMKISLDFQTLSNSDITALRQRIEEHNFCAGEGNLSNYSIEQSYIDRICSDVVIAQTLKVVIDASNGATSNVVVPLFEELGCEVIPLNCQVDGNFPGHPPDPTIEENLAELRAAVLANEADIGIAFDGDGDRVAVVSAQGACPRADRLLMILADDMVSRNPGCEIVFDVKSSRLLPELILARGGRPTMWKCGHSFMKQKIQDTGALLGGEYSGHIFFRERWYGFDDGMYTAARLMEALSLSGSTLDEELASHPDLISTPELLIPVAEQRKFEIVEEFARRQHFSDANIIDIDGVRLETRDGWGLIRASNTGPALTLRFEADSEAALETLRNGFREVLAGIDPALADSL